MYIIYKNIWRINNNNNNNNNNDDGIIVLQFYRFVLIGPRREPLRKIKSIKVHKILDILRCW